MRNSERPIRTCYSMDTHARVTASTASRIAHSTLLHKAIGRAVEKVETRQWNRADIYNRWGAHVRSIIRHHHVGIAIEQINLPLHINSDRQRPNPGLPGYKVGYRSPGNVLLPWRKRG